MCEWYCPSGYSLDGWGPTHFLCSIICPAPVTRDLSAVIAELSALQISFDQLNAFRANEVDGCVTVQDELQDCITREDTFRSRVDELIRSQTEVMSLGDSERNASLHCHMRLEADRMDAEDQMTIANVKLDEQAFAIQQYQSENLELLQITVKQSDELRRLTIEIEKIRSHPRSMMRTIFICVFPMLIFYFSIRV